MRELRASLIGLLCALLLDTVGMILSVGYVQRLTAADYNSPSIGAGFGYGTSSASRLLRSP